MLGKEQARDAFVTAEAGHAERGRGPSSVSQPSRNASCLDGKEVSVSVSSLLGDV